MNLSSEETNICKDNGYFFAEFFMYFRKWGSTGSNLIFHNFNSRRISMQSTLCIVCLQ